VKNPNEVYSIEEKEAMLDELEDQRCTCLVIGCKEPAKMHYDFGWTGPWCDKHFLDTTAGVFL